MKLITEILAILIIVLISFVGIYKQDLNKYKNQVKEYQLDTDLSGYREILFEISDATEVLDKDGNVQGNSCFG